MAADTYGPTQKKMPGIYTEIAIDATPEEVWDVLVDFERY